MLLTLTNSEDATADYLLKKLSSTTVNFLRLDTDRMLEDVSLSFRPGRPTMTINGRRHKPTDFTTVWYRRPEKLMSTKIPETPEGRCTLDEWSEALEGFFAHIPTSRWMNYPAANAIASRKMEQLTTAIKCGFNIPNSIVTQCPDELRRFFTENGGQLIVKPLGRAHVERDDGSTDSIIYTNSVKESDLDSLSDLTQCPTLFQQKIRKQSDVRITVVDADIHAVELVAKDDDGNQRCDIRRNNMEGVRYSMIELPSPIAKSIRQLMHVYGLRFGAIDMALADDGQWYFFEINPNGQWAWMDLLGVSSIYKSFANSFLRTK